MATRRILVALLIVAAICPHSNGYGQWTSTVTPVTVKPSSSAAPGSTTAAAGSSSTSSSSGSGGGSTTTSPSCNKSKYRPVDGRCSNLNNPSLGGSGQPYGRLLPPNYADGISRPPVLANGSDYASARIISFNVFGLDETPDPANTLLNIFFLNAIGNDLSLPDGSNDVVTCCSNGQLVPNPSSRCYPVNIPANDAIYSFFNIQCLNYARLLTATSQPGQPVQQINDASSLLDLSFLYGTTLAQSANLRTFSGGRLKAVRRNGVEWPVIDPAGCDWADVCYLVADRRSYQFPMSATIHLLFLREHNRLANQLKVANSLLSDDILFEEARRINIAQYQSIVFYEYLPRILGRDNMLSSGLIYDGTGFSSDYNRFQDPSAFAEFSNIIIPFMQTQLPGSINFYINDTIQSTRLSSLAGTLSSLEATFDAFFTGLARQQTTLVDTSFTIEWKNFMYAGNNSVGLDLLALDIQRMRDFGFDRYNDYRLRCGLGRFSTWEAFNATLKEPCPVTIQRFQSIYSTIDDMDLLVGGAFEKPLPGSVLGPTFSCLIRQQFLAARTGDRYFFEAGGQDGSFTAAQLTEIRKVRLSKLMCSGFPITLNIQADVFSPVSDSNPIVACSSLPGLNPSVFV